MQTFFLPTPFRKMRLFCFLAMITIIINAINTIKETGKKTNLGFREKKVLYFKGK